MKPLHAPRQAIRASIFCAALIACSPDTATLPATSTAPPAIEREHSLPRIVSEDGRHALLVDDTPFLMLCAQANNSTNYQAMLPTFWEYVEKLGANTIQIPIAWEQVEASEGHYDFSFLDTVLRQARERNVRVVPLWFGAFKNTNPGYAPSWVKLDNERFPRMITPDGQNHYALSPHTPALLEAEKRAFTALMAHLKEVDPQHTVIMVQVDNEVGVYGLVRDRSPFAQDLFDNAVPLPLVSALGATKGNSWADTFGADADEYFTAYGFAQYVGGLAEAGKAILDLPMYTNAALRHPIDPQDPLTYAAGGPTHNVLDIWKVSAPALDLLTPDIYMPRSDHYKAVLDHYDRPDNPLFVSETGTKTAYPRFFFDVLGHGAIGFSPFGIDDRNHIQHPPHAKYVREDEIDAFSDNFALVKDASREWARLAYESEIWGVARPDDHQTQNLDLGKWTAKISFDEWPFGYRSWAGPNAKGLKDPSDFPNAGILVARLAEDQFLVTGKNARIEFFAHPDALPNQTAIFVSVEQVRFDNGDWVVDRRLNGDQTDYGLNFTELNWTLRVTLGHYPTTSN